MAMEVYEMNYLYSSISGGDIKTIVCFLLLQLQVSDLIYC